MLYFHGIEQVRERVSERMNEWMSNKQYTPPEKLHTQEQHLPSQYRRIHTIVWKWWMCASVCVSACIWLAYHSLAARRLLLIHFAFWSKTKYLFWQSSDFCFHSICGTSHLTPSTAIATLSLAICVLRVCVCVPDTVLTLDCRHSKKHHHTSTICLDSRCYCAQ